MASIETNCLQCGTRFHRYGDGILSVDQMLATPSFDTDECCEAYTVAEADRALEAAKEAVRAAEYQLADLARRPTGASRGALGRGTVGELRAFAAARSIDLGDSTRKADIEAAIFAHMTVAELTAHAHANEIDLGGATRKDDIIRALSGGAVVEEPQQVEPASFTASFTPAPVPADVRPNEERTTNPFNRGGFSG